MRTSNPVLNERTFTQDTRRAELLSRGLGPGSGMPAAPVPGTMTIGGTIAKCLFLLGILVVAAAFIWNRFIQGGVQVTVPYLLAGCIGGLILALITTFAPRCAPWTSPIYAACEGLVLGALSAMLEARYKGIVITAVAVTFGVFLAMLLAYTSRVLRATPKFTMGMIIAMSGLLLVTVVGWLAGPLFGRTLSIYGAGPVGIGFSIAVTILAALNLILDFEIIKQGAESGAPKYMEWYGAFGLLVTLVWLYIEVLRLLVKLRGRR